MRPLRTAQRRAVALAALLLTALAAVAAPSVVRAATSDEPAPPAPIEPFGADCYTLVRGSHVIAYCHNPYPDTDRVRLHTECARWWDIDADAAPVEVGPAQTVRLTDRCWKEVRAVWVTHEKPGASPSPAGSSSASSTPSVSPSPEASSPSPEARPGGAGALP